VVTDLVFKKQLPEKG